MFGTVANGTLPAGPQIYLQPAKIINQYFEVSLKVLWMKTKCVQKIFNFRCVYFGQPVSENSVFRNMYMHKQTFKTIISYNALH